ncbi:Sensor histidine kinase ChvG [Candidatus Rhodobacter oscarellae]|uniref:histidine kinase n=1 Tax=Candidatus Rhodobacter oscarellae TaxID=1675527 RepID=A0A0J9ECW3_9RHOB|nr:sensor histidine kinase [Candidatus Rhodobacter lobularis]KMW60575.1 Sensor histidine kinase ChvG [Candidatus Rhodobacter lobularis]
MTLASEIDVRGSKPVSDDDLVLGEDWISPTSEAGRATEARRKRRSFIAIKGSPLARKIITFNLLGLLILVLGVLWLNPTRDNLLVQREIGLVKEAHLIADVFEAQLPESAPVNLITGDGIDVAETLAGLNLALGSEVYVYDQSGTLVAKTVGRNEPAKALVDGGGNTVVLDFLNAVWDGLARLAAGVDRSADRPELQMQLEMLVPGALAGETQRQTVTHADGGEIFAVAAPVLQGANTVAVIALASASGELDQLVRSEREQVLQMFVIAILVSIGLSLVLASTIANPISDLASAAEFGQDGSNRKKSPARVRIPDLSGRPDEIGRLSGAMRGMVGALYQRIDSNEQFAADVAHEIKNPLASLRSAIGTMRVAQRDDQRERLLEVIEHDVRRLDRLVSDISNASRLDSELVKEEEEVFDLLGMLRNLADFLGNEAQEKGVEFITDLPREPIEIHGLEARLAQVFVNLISNATSFCEEGDAIRVWARRRDNRVLVVVEDTGPGIPEEALSKIFNRFYSQRPEGQFGNNSGLGLAISKQIVEAHSGVIWAENIRPTDADVTSDPLGARFVVGLPV